MKKRTPVRRGWLGRMVFGASKSLDRTPGRYDSPAALAVQRFFRRPSACIALAVLLGLFLFVFLGPLFDPIDLSYSEPLHRNLGPSYDMMRLPAALSDDVRQISSYSSFSVGLTNAGQLYTWGSTYLKDIGIDLADLPEALREHRIVHAAAGIDHAAAITEDGRVICWGAYDNGQYGRNGTMIDMVRPQPEELLSGRIDADNVRQLICGNQVTALLMNDGAAYFWGNDSIGAVNMKSFSETPGLKKAAFLQSLIVGITETGEFVFGNTGAFDYCEVAGEDGRIVLVPLQERLGGRKVLDLAANLTSACLLMEDGELLIVGSAGDEIRQIPDIPEGETVVAVSGGARHYALLTDAGRVLVWGSSALDQTDMPDSLNQTGAADRILCAGFQTYVVKDDTIAGNWGFRGYLMGTDELGRDIFTRVMNGGRMTMTIGAAAVLISAVIGILVGCISGYFGGRVDLFLMRVTEIFSAIPFLPFALVLSAILRQTDVPETTRIFLIMVVLGILSWTGLARLIRGQVLAEREKDFVLAARSMGIPEIRIAFRHILPNVISVVLVSLTLDFAGCMLTEASLSYLGFGVQLPRPTWGNMLYGCNNSIVIRSYWWRWVFPALFLSAATIAINIIGDTLRDILDPKSEVK